MLSSEEKNRYSRHILLEKVGEEGQEKLKKAKVLVVGAGGLGCPVLQYLTAAGIGTLGIIDFDVVEESNLQRQILFSLEDIGKNKASAASEKLKKQNPHVDFDIIQDKLTSKNALQIFEKFDIIVDGTDNFSTRYLINDACIILEKPLVSGSIFKFEGQVSVFNYQNGPSYRCLFPEPPKAGTVPSCSEVGVIGVLAGIVGTQQANEVIKIILGVGKILSGKLMVYNSLNCEYFKLNIERNEKEIAKVKHRAGAFETFDYEVFCGISKLEEIDSKELKHLLETEKIQILDVREPHETPDIELENVINIPVGALLKRSEEISKNEKVVVICQHGIRSKYAIELLEEEGFDNLINFKGGIVRLTL